MKQNEFEVAKRDSNLNSKRIFPVDITYSSHKERFLVLFSILFSFRLPVCNARPIDIYYNRYYIYIICVPTLNRNNEFILEFRMGGVPFSGQHLLSNTRKKGIETKPIGTF